MQSVADHTQESQHGSSSGGLLWLLGSVIDMMLAANLAM